MSKAARKNRKSSDWLKPLKVVPDVEILESRVPVSEQISTLVALYTLGEAARFSDSASPFPASSDGSAALRLVGTENLVVVPAAFNWPVAAAEAVPQRPADTSPLSSNLTGDLVPLSEMIAGFGH
jgi:hypothetical protein